MASNLVLEDGTGLPNASTYDTAANIRAYCLGRGVVLATSDDAGDLLVDQMITKGMDYLEGKRDLYQGWRFKTTQSLQFPREGVLAEDRGYYSEIYGIRNGFENLISTATYRTPAPLPQELKTALAALVFQVKKGVDVMPTQISGNFVTFQKLGPLERHFSEAVGVYMLPQMPVVDATLAPLLKNGGALLSYRT